MPQMTLYAPDVTCDHCIATIRKTVESTEGARFVSGDPDTKSFVVEVDRGAVLDTLGEALAAEGYPLGDPATALDPASDTPLAPAGAEAAAGEWRPAYRVTPSEVGANVNYDCPCGCDAGFALDRSRADQEPEGCCCGRAILVGRDAAERLRAKVAGDAYIDVQEVTMPWGQPMEAAVATPRE